MRDPIELEQLMVTAEPGATVYLSSLFVYLNNNESNIEVHRQILPAGIRVSPSRNQLIVRNICIRYVFFLIDLLSLID